MKLIKPSQISGEILTLFEEADKKVIIVSPYCKIGKWYKLLSKLKSLLDRDIEVEFYVREGEYETIKEIEQIGIEPICIKNLHCKIYMNEKEAFISSMNLLLSSEMNSLDIAYKTTTTEEYKELLNFYNRYIKQNEKEKIIYNKNYLFETITNKFEGIRIYENENEIILKTTNNRYSCFIWNTGKNRQNKLRISGILSHKEFENSKVFINDIIKRTNSEIEFLESGHKNGFGYNSVWSTSYDFFDTESLNFIDSDELEGITDFIINFINEIQIIKSNN